MLADFVLLDTDLLTAPNEKLRGAKVLQTWIGGQLAFEKK
jgi:predicted amidohydrolase YtcJ